MCVSPLAWAVLMHWSAKIRVQCVFRGQGKLILCKNGLQNSTCKLGFNNFFVSLTYRHLSNIDCLMAHTGCLVCFISTVNGHSKKKRKKAKNVALVVGT